MSCRSKGILLVISGFAGTGKGTLVHELLEKYDNYALSVSATTRAPRPGEIDGVHYFFKTKEKFEEMKIQLRKAKSFIFMEFLMFICVVQKDP